jgi:hypothetical protein
MAASSGLRYSPGHAALGDGLRIAPAHRHGHQNDSCVAMISSSKTCWDYFFNRDHFLFKHSEVVCSGLSKDYSCHFIVDFFPSIVWIPMVGLFDLFFGYCIQNHS